MHNPEKGHCTRLRDLVIITYMQDILVRLIIAVLTAIALLLVWQFSVNLVTGLYHPWTATAFLLYGTFWLTVTYVVYVVARLAWEHFQ